MKRKELDWENRMILNLVQAHLTAITDRFLAVSVRAYYSQQILHVYYALAECRPVEIFHIEEAADDTEALTEGTVIVQPHLWIGTSWREGWPGRDFRMFFAAADRRFDRRIEFDPTRWTHLDLDDFVGSSGS